MPTPVSASPVAGSTHTGEARGLASPAYLLFVMTLIGTVNWADRQVLPILFPAIHRELGLNDAELGVIAGLAFAPIYALSSFFFGHAADRRSRKLVMATGLVVWSAATMASGLADSFWTLFSARFFTGVGEASLYPCALSLIAERFPTARRGRAIGVFNTAAALGSGLGVGLGGTLVESVGWHNVFFLYGAAGIAALPLLLLVAEAPRRADAAPAESSLPAIAAAFRDRRLLWLWACACLAMVAGKGFGDWVPSYFVRYLGADVTEAGALFGSAALVGGILGALAGGALSDRRRRAREGGEFDVSAGAALAAAVLMLVTLEAGRGPVSILGGLVATFAVYAIFPGLLAAMLSFVPPHRHGVTAALNTLFVGGIGAATGPFLVGTASELSGSLHAALYIPLAALCAAGVLALCARQAARHTSGAPSSARDAA